MSELSNMHKKQLLNSDILFIDKYPDWVYYSNVLKMSNKEPGGEIMKYPNIDAERARKGISNDRLAEDLGVTRKTLYNWLNKGNIPLSSLIKMADMFDCSIDYLLGRKAA